MKPVKLGFIMGLLEDLAPSGLAEPWDNVGLMIGSRPDPVSGVMVALDPTVEAVQAARKAGLNLLLTHHPLLFKPLSSVDPTTPTGAAVFCAVQEGVSILAAHTNLDSALGGVNDVLADLLGLKETCPLVPAATEDGAGMGRLGRLDQPRSLGKVAAMIKEALGTGSLRMVGAPDKSVSRVALCGGSGGDLVGAAFEAGADLYLTGEAAHHHAREAEFRGLALIEAGHYSTEVPVVPVLAQRLKKALNAAGFPLAVDIFEEERAPFYPA
jgi:dinuclear metal center YbgI/SA1388 family protein